MKTKKVLSVSKDKKPRKRDLKAAAPGGEELRARIVLAAREKFLAYGFSGVTTDDIAGDLGISKATLYKHFGSKEKVLAEVVESIKGEILKTVDSIVADDNLAFLDRITRLMLHVGRWFFRMGPMLMKDLHRNVPWVWEEIEAFRTQKILLNFRRLLEIGVREGDVRPDVDLDLAVQMFLALVQKFVNPEALFGSGRSALSILETLFKMIFGGILTGSAREAFFSRQGLIESLTKEVVP